MEFLKGSKIRLVEAYFIGKFPDAVFRGVRIIDGSIEIVEEKFIHLRVANCSFDYPSSGALIKRRKTGVFKNYTLIEPSPQSEMRQEMISRFSEAVKYFPNQNDLVGYFSFKLHLQAN